jgi:hypothetical protein
MRFERSHFWPLLATFSSHKKGSDFRFYGIIVRQIGPPNFKNCVRIVLERVRKNCVLVRRVIPPLTPKSKTRPSQTRVGVPNSEILIPQKNKKKVLLSKKSWWHESYDSRLLSRLFWQKNWESERSRLFSLRSRFFSRSRPIFNFCSLLFI